MINNALSSFACNIRRAMGRCERYAVCESKTNLETKEPCSLDTTKISNSPIHVLISILRDQVGMLTLSDADEENYKEIEELFDCLECELAGIVGKIGIGLEIAWPANIKASDESLEKYWAEHPEDA